MFRFGSRNGKTLVSCLSPAYSVAFRSAPHEHGVRRNRIMRELHGKETAEGV